MRANYPKGLGGPQNMNGMMKQVQKMQEEMTALQTELEEREYEVSAGGGMVKVKINGKREILHIDIQPDIVDPDDIETLADVVTAAVNEAIKKVDSTSGIGRKSAVRMAFAVLDLPDETVEGFSEALLGAKRKIRHCTVCHNFSVDEICPICADSTRDTSLICVVEDAKAVLAFEKIRGFRGVYHVLGGVISPINGVTPDKLHIADLAERVKDGVREVIVEYADEVTLNRAIEGRQDF